MLEEIKNQKKFLIFLLLIFIFSLSLELYKYSQFTEEEVFETKVEVLNIYKKEDKEIFKFKAKDFEFFSIIKNQNNINKFDTLNVVVVSKNIGFLDYLKGFYTTIIYFDKLDKEDSFKDKIIENITKNHEDKKIIELFQTLFLAIPVSKELREVFTNYSISHVVALSGFHLAILSFFIYWVLYFPYTFFHQKYFPYRNKRFDILLITIFVLLYYLILTSVVPSLLRAFVMFCLSVFFLRCNIKIFSYTTLLLTFLIVIAFFPKYIFFIGFWFSIFAVFYIYLFIQYFQNINKVYLFIFFNSWMFLIFNPIVHFYFPQTAIEQFYSIIITMLFTIFYPFEIVLHILGIAKYFDEFIKLFLEYKFYVYEVYTPLSFFIIYLLVSFLSIFYKKAFITLNILMIIFNFYLFLII